MVSLTEVEAYNYLRARSPVGLRSLIRRHELRTGRRFKYQFYFAAGYHYAWYIGSETIEQTKKQLEEETKEKAKS
tara:strand:+ start:7561 stop:7785 length:225 start_codon:yes stop_codon:yes gene_type:complete